MYQSRVLVSDNDGLTKIVCNGVELFAIHETPVFVFDRYVIPLAFFQSSA